MLNIEKFQTMSVCFSGVKRNPALVYGGIENIYHVIQSDMVINYYTLIVTYPDDSVLTYCCSSLSVAIANIEALERGEKI